MQLAVIIGGLIVALMFAILLYSNKFEVGEPNVGIVYLFGLITTRLVPGQKYYYIRKIGDFTIFKIVVMPGRAIVIHIKPDNAYTHNVRVNIDVEIIIWLKKARDGFPSYRACKNLLNLVQVDRGSTLFGQIENGEYHAGALDLFLSPFVRGAISLVLPDYDPKTITGNKQAVESLVEGISNAISPHISTWGTFQINVKDLFPIGEADREDSRRNAATEAENFLTIQTAQEQVVDRYITKYGKKGEKYAMAVLATQALKGAHVNLFGTGFTDAIGSFFGQKLAEKKETKAKKKGKRPQEWMF